MKIFLYFSTGSCVNNPLILPLASSQFASSHHGRAAYDVKINSAQTNCFRDTRHSYDFYVQIDFLFRHKICAIATVGDDGSFVDEYRISYGVKEDVWNSSSLFGAEYVSTGFRLSIWTHVITNK